MKVKTSFAVLCLAALAAAANLAARPGPSLEEDLQQLVRLGPIVYTTAHPDDESGPILTYLARGLHARVVLLCLTRGEGGQNQVGPELGEELGEVRTRELERAVAGYGAEVRFLEAEDFGYSKSVEESLRVWGEEKVLAELVRQIRELRPVAVISNWTGTEQDGGGAHHQAAGLLTRKAFALAGDARAFPEQLAQGYEPWQPRYLLVRGRSSEEGAAVEVPVGNPSPVAGKTFEELGWEAFRNHRSQGMGQIDFTRFRGRSSFLRVEATLKQGPPVPSSVAELVPDLAALPDYFPGVEPLAGWRDRLAQVVTIAGEARRLAAEEKPAEAALALVQGAGLLAALRREIPEEDAEPETNSVRRIVAERENEFLREAATLAGVELQAYSDRATITPSERVWVGLAVRVGAPEVFHAAGFGFGALRLDLPSGWEAEPLAAETTAEAQRIEYRVTVPAKLDTPRMTLPVLGAHAALTTGSLQLELTSPVVGLATAATPPRAGLLERLDPRRLLGRPEASGPPAEGEAGEQLEPVRLAPALTLSLEPRLRLVATTPGEMTREWCVHLEANRPQMGKTSVWLDVPVGWYTPLPQEIPLEAAGQRARPCFVLTLPGGIAPGRYELKAAAGRGIETYSLARRVHYAGTDSPTYTYEPATATVEMVDLNVPAGLRIGYIGFDTDPTPKLLAELGVAVDLLDDRALARARLATYDAIVVATRGYDYREDLAAATPQLFDFVQGGGTLIVEHQGRDWDPAKWAPYPGAKAPSPNLRVTDETAPVKVLDPAHPVFTFPNVIGESDWKDWVQERGVAFWQSWSEDYTPLVEIADPGEEPLRGSLLYARYGKGVYIYCGLALFRQMRAGVPGGVRVYINLLSQSRVARPEAESAPNPSSRP